MKTVESLLFLLSMFFVSIGLVSILIMANDIFKYFSGQSKSKKEKSKRNQRKGV